jgi:hypothetical protein
MTNDRTSVDVTNTHADLRKCTGSLAAAVLALGAPFAAASPAAASDHGGGHGPANGATGANPPPGPPPAEAGAAVNAGAGTKPTAGAGGHAGGAGSATTHRDHGANRHADSDASTAANTNAQAGAGGSTDNGRGTRAHANTAAPVGGHSGPAGDTRRRHRQDGKADESGRDSARTRGQADRHPRRVADDGKTRHRGPQRNSDQQSRESAPAPGASGALHDRSGASGHSRRRGFTDVSIATPADRDDGRVTARVKASPELDAAIRAEARAAAREEVRAGLRPTHVRARVPTSIASGASRVRTTGNDNAAAVLQMLDSAWNRGGPARARALLDLCLAGEASRALVLGSQGTGGTPAGEAEVEGSPRDQRHHHVVPIDTDMDTRSTGTPSDAAPGELVDGSTNSSPLPTSPSVASDVLNTDRAPAEAVTDPSSSGVGGASPITRAAAEATAQQLPFTGIELPIMAAFGAAALAAGMLLRRRASALH